MIPAQTDDAGMFPPTVCVACGVVEDLSVSLFHLLKGVGRVKGCYGDVTAVYDGKAFFEGIDAPYWVVASAFLFAGGAGADSSRSEAGTGPV